MRASSRVMDLGCGPGQLARAFAPRVAEVVALDPEPEMLGIARGIPAAGRVGWHQAGSGDLPGGFGRFDLVVMGRSFHWMDRGETLRRLDGMIVPGGGVALLHDEHPHLPDNAWQETYTAILHRYGGDDTVRAKWRSGAWIRHEGVLLQSPFARIESFGAYERRPIGLETLVERALSMSSTSRHRLGERAEEMIAEIGAAFAGESLREVVVSTALLAWRP